MDAYRLGAAVPSPFVRLKRTSRQQYAGPLIGIPREFAPQDRIER